jgi:hypothetical protein
MKRDEFIPGDWNAVCSMCGRKRKASQLVKNWQGMYRCKEHNEERHPQDFVRGVREVIGVPWAQPPHDDYVLVCDLETISATPGYAGPGCSMPGMGYYGVIEDQTPITPTPVIEGVILTEEGGYMLTEEGGYILLEI